MIARLRKKLAVVPGATLFLQAHQDIRIGGRIEQLAISIHARERKPDELQSWAPQMLEQIKILPELRDVSTDQQDQGLQAQLVIDRDTASRLGINAQTLDNTLYDAFGQRQVSTVFTQLNEYHLVMEVAPEFQENPDALKGIYLKSSSGHSDSAERVYAFRAADLRAGREPSRPISRGDAFVQSGAELFTGRRSECRPTNSARHRHCRPRFTQPFKARRRRFNRRSRTSRS